MFGLGLAVVSMGALTGAITVDEEKARDIEQKMQAAKLAAGEISESELLHKSDNADDHLAEGHP